MPIQRPPAAPDIGPNYVFPGPRAIRLLTLWALLCLAALGAGLWSAAVVFREARELDREPVLH